jgi:hypothetical protein
LHFSVARQTTGNHPSRKRTVDSDEKCFTIPSS